ncbi:MAG: hypothetical protein R3B96_16405 [Pirellulaceae bacterium]
MKAAGLGARDTLRLEAGMPLYGHELNEQQSAADAGIGFRDPAQGSGVRGKHRVAGRSVRRERATSCRSESRR